MPLTIPYSDFQDGAVVEADEFDANFTAIKTFVDTLETGIAASLPLSGGTMSGAIAMGSNKITGLATGTASGDAVNYDQITSLTIDAMPVGAVLMWSLTTLPSSNWVWADGSELLAASYPTLYAGYGTRWGTATAGYFKIPKMNSRIPIGAGAATGLTTRTLAQTGGNESVNVTFTNLPSHTHTATTSISDPGHRHQLYGHDGSSAGVRSIYRIDNYTPSTSYPINLAGSMANSTTGITASTSVSTQTGSSSPLNIVNPFIVMNFIIKAK